MAGRRAVAVVRPVVSLLALLLLIRMYMQRKFPSPKGVPYAKGHWLFGVVLEVLAGIKTCTVADWLCKQHTIHGKTFALSLPLQPKIVNTIDPANVEHVLKTRFDNYIKGDWFRDRLMDLLGNGIFNVDGPMWHSQRKISSRMFTKERFENHIWHVVSANCARTVQILRDVPKGETIDVFNLMNRFTLDTIGSIGFARDIDSLSNPGSPFLKSFDRAQQICVQRFLVPMWQLKKLLGMGEEGEAKHHFKALSDYSLETVQLLKEDCSGGKGNSFVGMFIQEAKQRGKTIDDEFLKDMVLNFLIAGRDTTAQSLSWIFWLLTGHPAVEEKIIMEIEEVVGQGPITYESSSKLIYLQNVINEGLRLYPSVPADSKICMQDDTLPDGTFVPRGSVVQYFPYGMGRCKELWGDDAEEFKPERWEGREFPSSFVYTAFNAGPRECLGKRLAWVEMRACLAEVLRAVRLELAVPREFIKKDTQLTIGMSTGLPCRVVSRCSRGSGCGLTEECSLKVEG